jgi:hypothetical protein
MKKWHHSRTMLVAGILGIAIGACRTNGDDGNDGGAANSGSGGSDGKGGAAATGGSQGSGGEPTGSGGREGTGGKPGSGGRTGGNGGKPGAGGDVGGGGGSTVGTGGVVGGKTGTGRGGTPGGTGGTGGKTSTGTNPGTCTASKDAGKSVSGTGSHKVVIETNSDAKVSCGTIFRPADLGGAEKYPIFVWGEGGCSRNGLSNQAAMGEIASHGYFVVADGPAGSSGSCGSISMSTDVVSMAKVMLGYIDWAVAENDKPCSAYYQSLDTTKIASDGFSCGGLMSMGTAADPRMTAVAQTSSGLTSAVASYYKTIHTPFKILLGGSGDVAYSNGMRDYDEISALGIPVILFSKDGAGHGGDLSKGTGDFNSVNLAWLNWQLKGDMGTTGKGALVGSTCKYCKTGWEYKSKNIE